MFPFGSPLASPLPQQCEVHLGMSWFSPKVPRRCWVCHPEDWNEPEGTVQYSTGFDPEPSFQPPVRQCVVLRSELHDRPCTRPWDGEHTVLGFAICTECYASVT